METPEPTPSPSPEESSFCHRGGGIRGRWGGDKGGGGSSHHHALLPSPEDLADVVDPKVNDFKGIIPGAAEEVHLVIADVERGDLSLHRNHLYASWDPGRTQDQGKVKEPLCKHMHTHVHTHACTHTPTFLHAKQSWSAHHPGHLFVAPLQLTHVLPKIQASHSVVNVFSYDLIL